MKKHRPIPGRSNLNRIDSSMINNNDSSIVNMHYQEERDLPIRNLQNVNRLNEDSEEEQKQEHQENMPRESESIYHNEADI